MLLALLIAAAGVPQTPCGPDGPILSCPNTMGALAFFEFAPASGKGMGAACACTTPTGAKGEALTFTRAGSGTCLKGNTTSSIATGDMVTCSTDQARVMPGGDGTGGLGLLVEGPRTNLALRSQEFSNAAWTVANSGSSNPVVTADQGVAPDNTTTADRVQFAACGTASNSSIIFQTVLGAAGANTGSVFCKGTSASQTISVCAFDDGANAGTCSQVTCPSTSWTRASQSRTVAATTGGLVIGCNNGSNYTGAASTGTADVLLWGGQYEAGGFASSYIATAGAAVARAYDLADVALTFGAGTTGFSFAGTLVLPSLTGLSNPTAIAFAGDRAPGVTTGSTSYSGAYLNSLVLTQDTTASTPNSYAGSLTAAQTTNRFVTYHTGANLFGCMNGTCDTGVAATWSAPTWTRMRIGAYDTASGRNEGVTKRLCIDPSPTRCR